jgi:hypothetical protein
MLLFKHKGKIRPIFRKEQVAMYTDRFQVAVPELLQDGLQSANKKDQEKIGREWLLFQCQDLRTNGYPHLHYFIFSAKAAEIVLHVLHQLL